jgi:hypothetical protein
MRLEMDWNMLVKSYETFTGSILQMKLQWLNSFCIRVDISGIKIETELAECAFKIILFASPSE